MYLLPVALFALLAVGFYGGLETDTNVLPSPLIDKPAPEFALPSLAADGAGFSSADLNGKVSLVNVFASWCVPCRAEHKVLTALAQTKRVPIFGIDYKDKPPMTGGSPSTGASTACPKPSSSIATPASATSMSAR
jgi:cytochrome c biogenesis protein CcmG/thiol:disulfide interchange protein DsbE